jgi:hypothetical protein
MIEALENQASSEAARALLRGWEANIRQTPGNDPVINALARASIAEWSENPDLRTLIDENMGVSEGLAPVHAAGKYRVGLQLPILHDVTNGNYRDIPRPFAHLTTPEAWRSTIRELIQPGPVRNAIAAHMQDGEVITNVISRYTLPQLVATVIAEAAPERFDSYLRVVDVGSSVNFGLKRWGMSTYAAENPGGFAQTSPGPVEIIYPESNIVSPGGTKAIAKLMGRLARLKAGFGIDQMDIADQGVINLARSCYYPKEYDHPGTVGEFDYFTAINPRNVKFYRGDATKLNFDDLYRKLDLRTKDQQQADVGMSLTMMYELQPHEREQVRREIMPKLIRPGGIFIEQDFEVKDPHDPQKLITSAHSFGAPYQYRTFVWDVANMDAGPKEWFVSETGRCQSVRYGKDFGMLGDVRIARPIY